MDLMEIFKKIGKGLVYFALVLAVLWFTGGMWPKVALGSFPDILANIANWQMWIALLGGAGLVSFLGEGLTEMLNL